jgi:signal transduction histidine kinase
MEKKLLNNDANKELAAIRTPESELLKVMPPVAILSLHEIVSYCIKDEEDVARFTKGLKPDYSWLERAEEEIPLLSEGLASAAKNFCATVPNLYFRRFGREGKIEKQLKTILYLSLCELVNNAVEHAGASHIFVQVVTTKHLLSVTVYDDGKSFDPATVTTGNGLRNIATGVIACKGKMEIHSSPEKGTEINIEIEL